MCSRPDALAGYARRGLPVHIQRPHPAPRCPSTVLTAFVERRLDADLAFHVVRVDPIEPWQAVMPVRPDTAHSRSLRFLDVAGELLAAVAIIGGGMMLTGLATLL